MNKPLKFSSKTHRIYVVSDLHMGHNPLNWDSPALWATRGFKSIEEHDAWVKDQWFKTMDDSCIILNLGDAVFSDPKGERFRQLTTWPGRQYHVWGNHRSGATQIYRQGIADMMSVFGPSPFKDGDGRYEVYPITANNLTFVGESLHAWIDGISVYCQHYAPFIWPELSGDGFALCGHSHRRAEALNPEARGAGKVMDCGVDNAIAYAQSVGREPSPFFSWDDIKTIMARKPVVKRDHH